MRSVFGKANKKSTNFKVIVLLKHLIFILFFPVLLCSHNAIALQQPPALVIDGFNAIRAWMHNDFTVTADQTDIPLSDEGSICIVLRHHGAVLGYGMGSTLRKSAHKALAMARKHRMLTLNIPNQFLNEMIHSISIELEISTTVVPSPHKNIDRFEYGFNRGVDGIAVRRGKDWNRRMQSELRLTPYRSISNITESLCINLGVHPAIALSHELPLQEDVTLYSIPSTTYIQHTAGFDPVFLYRGDELIDQPIIHESHIIQLADSLANHILLSIGEHGNMIGGYQPETNTFTSMFATHVVQALSACALHQYTTLSNITHKHMANEALNKIIRCIAQDVEHQKTIDLESASLIVLLSTVCDFDVDNPVASLNKFCNEKVVNAATTLIEEGFESIKPFTLSLLADAIVSIGAFTQNNQLLALGNTLVSDCLHSISPDDAFTALPWIVDAAFKLQQIDTYKHHASLDLLFQQVVASQITNGDLDLLGGFALYTDRKSVVDARGLRMIPTLAQYCNSSVTRKSDAFRSLVLAIRHLDQLTTSAVRSKRFENPEMALGGVRKSTWDATMPTEATAMALLGISDFVIITQGLQSTLE